MPEANQQGAKPATSPAGEQKQTVAQITVADERRLAERRDKFYLVIAGAIMGRQNGRSALALARECRNFTDEFLAALDNPK